jgi:hypothetical membrane protein
LQWNKIAAFAGVITPVLAFTCILIAIESYPNFSWTNNALSDLGIIPGLTGLIFNLGLCASGILALFFSVFSLYAYIGKRWAGKIGAAIFSVATIALVAIGIFNESYSITHTAVSIAFFVMMPISLLVITSTFLLDKRIRMAILTALIAIAAATPWTILFEFRYVPGVAIPETISGLAVSAWTIIISYKIIRQAKN